MVFRKLAVLGMVAMAAACGGDDGPTGTSDGLTQSELNALGQAIFENSFSLEMPTPSGAVGAALMDVVTFSTTVSANVPCEAGGSMDAEASITVSIDTPASTGTSSFQPTSVAYQTTQTHRSCVIKGDNIRDITLNGAPNILNDYQFTIDQTQSVDFSGTISGAVDWALDGGDSGTCQMDLTFTGSGSAAGSGSTTVSGSVCGTQVSITADGV